MARCVVAAAAMAGVMAVSGMPCAEAACADCGSVAGLVAVEQAFIRTDGPKHDKDVVVMLEPVGSEVSPLSSATASMDQSGLVFLPHVLAVQRGTTVTFLNNDREQHNVYFLDDQTGETLDIGTWGPGVSVDHTFDTPGMVITLCKLHLEMAAYVVVTPAPWFTTIQLQSAETPGQYRIEDVPAGRYELSVWHKKLKQKGGSAQIHVTAGQATEVDVVITKAKYARASR